MTQPYDVIIVGARCAGSPTALLLARKGYRVLLVDSATFPSDTLSTHVVHPVGMEALARWGLADRLVATGCPGVHTYVFDFGPVVIGGSPGTASARLAYCPRRTVLDKLLVDAAAEAGVEVREGFTVDAVLLEDGVVTGIRGRSKAGAAVTERARVVVGADGRHSKVAAAVDAARYHEKPPLQAGYYTYFSGLPMNGRFETFIRPGRGFAAVETHDGLTMVVAGWPYSEFEASKRDVEGSFLRAIETVPEFARRVRAAKREARYAGAATPNFFRRPYGAGWALVGDAGYLKDPITAQGIPDAFHDAELCAAALDASFSGAQSFDEAMAAYQRARDARALPMYELTLQIATLAPPPPDMQALLGALQGNQPAMDAFVRMNAGGLPPPAFFGKENVSAIFSAARRAS